MITSYLFAIITIAKAIATKILIKLLLGLKVIKSMMAYVYANLFRVTIVVNSAAGLITLD